MRTCSGAAIIGSRHRHLEQIAPMNAGMGIQATVHLHGLPLSPWAGLGVLGLWAAGALILGALVLQLRDARVTGHHLTSAIPWDSYCASCLVEVESP
jgi:hypothetical protein